MEKTDFVQLRLIAGCYKLDGYWK